MKPFTLNLVTCGQCGDPFAHKLGVNSLQCPYCPHEGDICDFPDMFAGIHHNHSLIQINEE